uniref:Uncharacterized protein n=1 Tax=Candidatus Methanogaster sp. ANME-2c ERB4 TaxID=2759911 RepID=A0A7G9YQE6_9EURY|nr:hypothetical protein PFOEMBKA_00002 [Methanosarcinales archaeon ANME-2c ERB4]
MTDLTLYRARYQFELTGKKARDLPELLAAIKEIDESSIFNHVYHALLDSHFLPTGYPNDFAYWIIDALHEPVLAERLANLDLREFHNMEALREEIIRIIEDYMAMHDVSRRVDVGQEFYFIRCISVTFPTKYVVTTMNEALETVKEIDLDSIFYYFIASRLLGGEHYKELSRWILRNDSHELIEKLDSLYPYGFANMDALRNEIVRIIEGYFWEAI